MAEKTDLQRDILLTWYENPSATNREIAEACDCSASYVSQVKNRFDDYDHMEAMMDRQDRELEQMFGEDVFATSPPEPSLGQAPAQQSGVGIATLYEETPDNAAGYLVQAFILLILGYVLYETVTILLL